ncbi:hypothetical protein CTEN210_09135 [Chaetoceros tenuissimus]|uniref:Ankyrin repeat-containing domain n=1 Tax=Chaetoceros tenuissimus TaxID=426638 RepID=A0AAD3CVI7_9STRA|nr:hypothetical protein CTEN210_09135 [Chaetoceros tenuissimus]
MSSMKIIKVTHEADEDDMSLASHHDKHIQDLPNDVFRHCLEFVGKGSFAFVAPVSKHFYWNYINLGVEMKNNVIDVDAILQQGKNKKTTAKDVATGPLRLATECFLKAPKKFKIEVCRQAAVNGRLDILECAVAFGIDMKESVFPYDDDGNTQSYEITVQLVAETVANGHLNVVEFLHDEGVDLDNEDIIAEIGDRGKARKLHWMVSKGMISFWKAEVFNCLVRDGEIDILKESYEFPNINRYTFNICAGSGSLTVMNWLLQENDLSQGLCEWSSYLFSKAATSGSIPMMELCLRNGCQPRECSSAMENKNKEAALVALKWLREHNIPWNERVCEHAAMYGNLKALKWLRENGCPWDSETFNFAAQYGSIEILDYCLENNCPMDHDSIYHYPFDDDEIFDPSLSESQERSLIVYKWLHQHSIPWDEGASRIAARHGHLKTLMWAIENGCPWHEDILGCAIGQFDFPMVEYCIQHLSPMDDYMYVFAMDKMNENQRRLNSDSDAKMIKLLLLFRDYGIPWSRDIIPQAERIGRSNVANWLRCIGCPE